jgi:Domain of unknown function (DUF2383)
METEHCIDVCNRLLRGERSAIETYDQALEKYGSDPAAETLRRVRDEHARAVATLEENIRSMGGEPDREAGAWGVFANTVQSAANLFGTNSALEARNWRKGREERLRKRARGRGRDERVQAIDPLKSVAEGRGTYRLLEPASKSRMRFQKDV